MADVLSDKRGRRDVILAVTSAATEAMTRGSDGD